MPSTQAYLDPQETTVVLSPASASAEPDPLAETSDPTWPNDPIPHAIARPIALHRHWHQDRLRTFRALRDSQASPGAIVRFCTCGWKIRIYQRTDDPTQFTARRLMCRNRWCRVCAHARAARIRSNLLPAMANRTLRLLTLTLKHTDTPLTTQLTRLIRAFRRLRSTKLWKERVQGGIFTLELTRNDTTHTWHPHLHCILEGRFIAQPDLSALWLRATGDSHVVDIRLIRQAEHAADYITKYLAKPLAAKDTTSTLAFAEAIDALKGKRTVGTFGTWTKLKMLTLLSRPHTERPFASIEQLREAALTGNLIAAAILRHLAVMPPDTVVWNISIADAVTDELTRKVHAALNDDRQVKKQGTAAPS